MTDVPLNLSVDEVLSTTRSVRKRLDFDRPVAREILTECLELALQAPTGSNAQGWQFVFVDEPDRKEAIAQVYRTSATAYFARGRTSYGDSRDERAPKVASSAQYLSDNMHRAPVLLIPCLAGRPDGAPAGESAAYWGSLLPAAWSFMLALRARGLGSAWTTLHLLGDGERQVADLLGIPFDDYAQGGLFPVAYTLGTDFRRASRLPAEELTHWNTW